MSCLPKILLIGVNVPGQDGPGALMLKDLLSHYPQDLIFGVFPWEKAEIDQRIDRTLSRVSTKGSAVSFNRIIFSRFGKPGRIANQLLSDFQSLRKTLEFGRQAVALGFENQIDIVWAILDGPASCLVASYVANTLKKPLFAYIQDDYRHLVYQFNLDPLLSKLMSGRVIKAINMSENCAVAGNSMGEAYKKELNATCINLWHGIDERLWLPLGTTLTDDPILRIGFAGSVTAGSAFRCLLKALDSVNWKIHGRSVKLILMGYRFQLISRKKACIEYLGYQSLESSIAALNKCDILYLPQPFEKEWQYMTKLSFPVKLMTYLAAGRPIILHAPPDSSLAQFDKAGIIFEHCSKLNTGELILALNSLIKNPDLYRKLTLEGRTALKNFFSKSVVRSLFAEFLKIDEKLLMPRV